MTTLLKVDPQVPGQQEVVVNLDHAASVSLVRLADHSLRIQVVLPTGTTHSAHFAADSAAARRLLAWIEDHRLDA